MRIRGGEAPAYSINDTGIIIQGPIEKKNDFTKKVALWYRKIYRDAPIVISTWIGESDLEFARICKDNEIFLIENELPTIRGISNVNCQIKSSYEGAKYLKEHTNVKFALKCRTDQWFSRPDFLLYLRNLLYIYPPGKNKLKSRLVMQLGSTMPFFLSDFYTFGTIGDIFNLYGIPYENEESAYMRKHIKRFHLIGGCLSKIRRRYAETHFKGILSQQSQWKKHAKFLCKFVCAEIYIFRTFYDKYIETVNQESLMEQYLDFLRNYIVVPEKLYIYWPKYEPMRLEWLVLNGNEQQREWSVFMMIPKEIF